MMAGTTRSGRVGNCTHAHLVGMVDFMERHQELESNKLGPGINSAVRNKLWGKLTSELNAIGGQPRVASQWRRAWTDLKGRVRRKLSPQNSTTGAAEPSDEQPALSHLEERVFRVMQSAHNSMECATVAEIGVPKRVPQLEETAAETIEEEEEEEISLDNLPSPALSACPITLASSPADTRAPTPTKPSGKQDWDDPLIEWLEQYLEEKREERNEYVEWQRDYKERKLMLQEAREARLQEQLALEQAKEARLQEEFNLEKAKEARLQEDQRLRQQEVEMHTKQSAATLALLQAMLSNQTPSTQT